MKLQKFHGEKLDFENFPIWGNCPISKLVVKETRVSYREYHAATMDPWRGFGGDKVKWSSNKEKMMKSYGSCKLKCNLLNEWMKSFKVYGQLLNSNLNGYKVTFNAKRFRKGKQQAGWAVSDPGSGFMAPMVLKNVARAQFPHCFMSTGLIDTNNVNKFVFGTFIVIEE